MIAKFSEDHQDFWMYDRYKVNQKKTNSNNSHRKYQLSIETHKKKKEKEINRLERNNKKTNKLSMERNSSRNL